MNWSFRARITLILTVLVLIPTIVTGCLGYWTASSVIRNETIRTVGIAAQTKKELLLFRLNRQNERAIEFLESVQSTCIQKGRADKLCVDRLLNSFMKTDDIIDADLTIPGLMSLQRGPNSETLKNHPPFIPKQLAQFSSRADKIPTYIIEARSETMGSIIVLRYGTKKIEDIFTEPTELGISGETFLADSKGFFLTEPKYKGYQGESHPIDARPMLRCLTKHDSEMLAEDYRPVPVVHAFKYISEIGGGCIMAHIQQDEAFAPLKNLRSRILFFAAIFSMFAISLSFWIAYRFSARFTRPLTKLVERMKAAQLGDLDSPVPTEGPKEIAVLGHGFADLALQLKKNIEVREDFVAIVSHDLKNPLSVLSLNISLMEKNISSLGVEAKTKLMPQIVTMRRNLLRMIEMIGSVLNMTTIRSGNFTLNCEPQNLNSLIAEVVDSSRLLMGEKGIVLKVELPDHEVIVKLDRGRIFQVLSNLLGNALKFTPQGGEITLQILEREKEIQFLVRDTGPGIPSEELERIFERYHQVGQGADFSSGLGLYISKEIISAHGGRIWAESELGIGSKFYFTLPLL